MVYLIENPSQAQQFTYHIHIFRIKISRYFFSFSALLQSSSFQREILIGNET